MNEVLYYPLKTDTICYKCKKEVSEVDNFTHKCKECFKKLSNYRTGDDK